MFWTDLHNHIPLQQGPRSYIPLESICLFVGYCHEFRNRESYDGFVLPVERKRQKPPIWFINLGKELREFTLFSKLFFVTKMKIPKNMLKRITRHWIRLCLHKRIGGCLPYILWSGSLLYPLSSSILKNKRIFLLLILKLISAFSLWLYNLVYTTIISTNPGN